MTKKEMRAEARSTLKGHWLKIWAFMSAFIILLMIFSLLIADNPLGAIIITAISVTLGYNMVVFFIKFVRKENPKLREIITKTPDNFVTSWKITWGIIKKMWLYLLVGIIVLPIIMGLSLATVMENSPTLNLENSSGTVFTVWALIWALIYCIYAVFAFIKVVRYQFAFYTMHDSGCAFSGKEATDKSESLMRDKVKDFILFMLPFIGWTLLIILIVSVMLGIFSATYTIQQAGLDTAQYEAIANNLSHNILVMLGYTFILSIGTAYIMPYMYTAYAVYYENLLKEKK